MAAVALLRRQLGVAVLPLPPSLASQNLDAAVKGGDDGGDGGLGRLHREDCVLCAHPQGYGRAAPRVRCLQLAVGSR